MQLQEMLSLAGKTVVVTGGASGIGFALAQKFHQAGNQVILVGRSEATLLAACKALQYIELTTS